MPTYSPAITRFNQPCMNVDPAGQYVSRTEVLAIIDGLNRELAEVRTNREVLLKACRQAIYAIKGREHDGFLRDAIAEVTGANHDR